MLSGRETTESDGATRQREARVRTNGAQVEEPRTKDMKRISLRVNMNILQYEAKLLRAFRRLQWTLDVGTAMQPPPLTESPHECRRHT